ncbi:hypothetical protein FBZ89_114138 [Nitrospirillum amazonense]|uniref:Uncharacterized protein n=1 Tax=Nitrospirillum amazonense TaxID=28077 RepID=A0A560F1Q6_9PROT|nr:hypothetical protein [Nitrospirillum amazonense]TWB15544.1 hypothetical protein FBZ89_114138 [Nitrospirillum amazonense]
MSEPPRPIQPCRIVWQGIPIDVTYEANWLSMDGDGVTAHLEVRAENRRRLPFTETGYRSHFLPRGIVEAAGGSAAYVLAWLEEAAQSEDWRQYRNAESQLSLF